MPTAGAVAEHADRAQHEIDLAELGGRLDSTRPRWASTSVTSQRTTATCSFGRDDRQAIS